MCFIRNLRMEKDLLIRSLCYMDKKNKSVQKTKIEIIFGKKATKLFPILSLFTILSSVLIKSTNLYVKLLATAMFGIVTFSAVWIIYKTIKFKIHKKESE